MSQPRPLEGVRVVEFARILAGPWAGQLLADLGAEVIKVEAPEGDETRRWGPPFLERADGTKGDAAYFHACNRGKRSIVADYRTPEGQDLARRLAAQADVVIENFKVGGLVKYGLDAASLRGRDPRLIYCSITGFGQDGPYAARAGYDFLIQGMAGVMSISGEPEGEPVKSGVAISDIFTGLYAANAILAALIERERTGMGRHIDMALLDSQVSVLAYQALNYLVSGKKPRRMGNGHPNIVPYQVFPVADGHVIVATGNDAQYRRFCAVIGASDLGSDAAWATNAQRVAGRDELVPRLSGHTARMTRADILAGLEREGVPAGPINEVPDVFADPQVIARRMRVDLPDPALAGGSVPGVRSPIVYDGEPVFAQRASPRLDADREAILSELEQAGTTPGSMDRTS
jgi:crotonobetainyl-CoA:carnitine CoA-transferase CaiB-like acyl-CoA transferase